MNGDYISIIPKVLPIFILLGTGFLLKVKKFVSQSTIGEVKKLIVNLSLPAVLFTAFLTVDLRIEFLLVIFIVFLSNILMLFIGKKVAQVSGVEDPHFPLLFTGYEVGMLGISLFGTIYGLENMKYLGVVDLGQEFYVWFVLLALLYNLRNRDQKESFNSLFKSFITSPIIIAILSGLILNSTGLHSMFSGNFIYNSFLNSIELLASIAIPLILLVIGFEINFGSTDLTLPLKIIGTRLIVLLPLAILSGKYIFTGLLGLNIMYSVALVSVFILPPPFIIPLFISEEDSKNKTYIYNTLSISTVISIIIFVIITLVYGVNG